MTQSNEELQNRIAVLERKNTREKKARNLAEQQLEKYSLEIYETNKSLKTSLLLSEKRQNELEFLSHISSQVGAELSLPELFSNVVELMTLFCHAECGFYFTSLNGKFSGDKEPQAWYRSLGWKTSTTDISTLADNLPLSVLDAFDTWQITNVNEQESERSLLYLNFILSGGEQAWLVFIVKNVIEEHMLAALNTAKGQLQSGIRRRLADERILRRNQQLQDTVDRLEQAKKQLIQSEKMASLGQLAAGVAHEINNPVAFIRSNLEVLQQYLNDYKQLHAQLGTELKQTQSITEEKFTEICKNTDLAYIEEDSADLLVSNIDGLDRVREIVENLKTFSHAGEEELQDVDLFSCIDGALKITSNVFKYEHQVNNELVEPLPSILGNSSQLQQVFVNLFVNASHAMEGGGTLTISSLQTENKLTLQVTDTGCGMDDKTLDKLFTPFFTTKPVGVGTGLGLSVSYAILEAHNAEVEVNSKVGEGTTFSMTFAVK